MTDDPSTDFMRRHSRWRDFGERRLRGAYKARPWELGTRLPGAPAHYFARLASIRDRLREASKDDLAANRLPRLPLPTATTDVDGDSAATRELSGTPEFSVPEIPPRFLESRYREMLERVLQFRLPPIQVHTGRVADTVARRYGADAVTLHDAILFRQGKYDPDSRSGLGLLAHEATHIAWARGFRPGALAGRTVSDQSEEQTALQRERTMLRAGDRSPRRLGSALMNQAVSAPERHSTPKAAASNRELGIDSPSHPAPAAGIVEDQVRQLKEDLYRSILEKLRSDFERGELERMSLDRASITNLQTGEQIPVMFNPAEYSFDAANTIAEIGIPGLRTPPVQFVRGNARTLKMELFFDSYEVHQDIREQTLKITGLLELDEKTQAPPILLFTWGTFSLKCILESVGQRFTMFLEDGTPVRATLNVSLREFQAIDVEIKSGLFIGPPTLHNIVGGETASKVAEVVLGDPHAWREIADLNNLDNPRLLPAGLALIVPPKTPKPPL